MISQWDWEVGSLSVAWEHRGQLVRLEYELPPQSALFVSDPASVVVVEAIGTSVTPSNAVVYDLDGRERIRLRPPDVPEPVGFDQVFMSSAGLVAVYVTRRGDFQGEPDLLGGSLIDRRDWR